MENYSKEIITIRFDKEMLEGFTGYSVDNPKEYFKLHPRAKKPPFENLHGKNDWVYYLVLTSFLMLMIEPNRT